MSAQRARWFLQGKSGRAIGWRIKLKAARYKVGVGLASRVCRGNRWGVHTDAWPAHRPLGGQCFCSRVRNRLDFIPF